MFERWPLSNVGDSWQTWHFLFRSSVGSSLIKSIDHRIWDLAPISEIVKDGELGMSSHVLLLDSFDTLLASAWLASHAEKSLNWTKDAYCCRSCWINACWASWTVSACLYLATSIECSYSILQEDPNNTTHTSA